MNEDLIIKTVVELKQDMVDVKIRLSHLESGVERIENGQDKIIGMLERLDTERVATHYAVQNLEKRVTVLEKVH